MIVEGFKRRLCSSFDCFSSISRSKEITCEGDLTEVAAGLDVIAKGFNYCIACVATLVEADVIDSFLRGEALGCVDVGGSEEPNAANCLPFITFF